MSKRPYVIGLMMASLDGKILGHTWGDSPEVKKLVSKFEEVHEKIGQGAWIVGRTTMEKDFTKYAKPTYKPVTQPIPRTDSAVAGYATTFAIAVDAKGKLGWEKATMHGDHVITILTEGVEDGYLAHLQSIGVSYIFAGKENIDLNVALEKLYALFNIEVLMLEGGGHLNGSFLDEGLVDEYNHILLPLADGAASASTVFEKEEKKRSSTVFKLEEVRRIEDDVLWLTYKAAKQ